GAGGGGSREGGACWGKSWRGGASTRWGRLRSAGVSRSCGTAPRGPGSCGRRAAISAAIAAEIAVQRAVAVVPDQRAQHAQHVPLVGGQSDQRAGAVGGGGGQGGGARGGMGSRS